MRCKNCDGRLALRLIEIIRYPIETKAINRRYQVTTEPQWVDLAEVFCTTCGTVQNDIKINYDNNGVPSSIE